MDGLIGQPQPTSLYLGKSRLCQFLQFRIGGHPPMLFIMGADHAEHDLGQLLFLFCFQVFPAPRAHIRHLPALLYPL